MDKEMNREVRLKIRSTRFEVEASLFSDNNDDLDVYDERDLEPESIEINTVGVMKAENGRVEVSYDETEATGMDGSTTALTYMENEKGVVSMIREGTVSTALVFESGKRHHCLYNTPYMPFEICVRTLKVDNRLADLGYIDLDYVVEIRGAKAERTKFRMEVL